MTVDPAYLLTSWSHLHGGIYRSPADVFRAVYANHVDTYFNGSTPGEVMISGLPATVAELLTPRGVEVLRHPRGSFDHALDAADRVCGDWHPSALIRLYTMSGDEQAVNANTDGGVEQFSAARVPVERMALADATYQGSRHLASNIAATPQILRWFAALSAPTPNHR